MARRFGGGRITARGIALSASRITQAHQLVGAVLKYAQRTGKIAKNVAGATKRTEDLPTSTEQVRRYLTHAELLQRRPSFLATADSASVRPALRRKHVGDPELTIRSSATYVTGGWD
ncbi:hypothetical protein A4G29_04250 [Mycobacterium kansasii]|nr:hypothetical protein A4G29_04250 [Mycobacterium kansasii]